MIPLCEDKIELLKLMFPIGSTYITQTNTDPATILCFGEWERVKGRVLVGLNENDEYFNEIGKEGGETKHTQTIAEMPSHNHDRICPGRQYRLGFWRYFGVGWNANCTTSRFTRL